MSRLPLTPNGKLDRRALAQSHLQRELSVAYAPPRTPAEERLASLWAEVLGRERVGIHDNFFELGGHSLLAIRLMAKIEATHHLKLPLSALFHGPTVAELTRYLEQPAELQPASAVPAWVPLVPLQPRGTRFFSDSGNRICGARIAARKVVTSPVCVAWCSAASRSGSSRPRRWALQLGRARRQELGRITREERSLA